MTQSNDPDDDLYMRSIRLGERRTSDPEANDRKLSARNIQNFI